MTDRETKDPFRVIILGPGGIKALLILGALFRYSEEDLLRKVNTFVGVSAGSLISLFLVAGYTIPEIIIEAVSGELLSDVCTFNLTDIKKSMGVIDHKNIEQKLSQKMIEKFGMVPTLSQLYLATGLTYISVAYDLTDAKPRYFSWEKDPNLSCVQAALFSMNIPIVFQSLSYQGHYFVDGALGDPYPVGLLDDGKTPILGMSIDSSKAATGFVWYLHNIIQAPMTQLRNLAEASSSSMCSHLLLHSRTIDTLGLSLTSDDKVKLMIDGYSKAKEFIQETKKNESSAVGHSYGRDLRTLPQL